MLRLLTSECQVRCVSGGHYFVLNSTLIVFVEYSFSHVPLPYNKFHVSLKGCSQIIEIGTFINESTYLIICEHPLRLT